MKWSSVNQQQQQCVAGLLLSTMQGDIDRQRRAPAPSSNSATAQRSAAANAGNDMLTAKGRGCTKDLLHMHH